MNVEIFRKIPGFEIYSICENGKTIGTKKKTELKPIKSELQWYVDFNINGKQLRKKIAELVAITFLPNPKNHKYIKFKDGEPSNYHKKNLTFLIIP